MKNNIVVPLEIFDQNINVDIFTTNFYNLKNDQLAQKIVDKYPGVYYFFDQKSIYIGESIHPFKRLLQHRASTKLKAKDHIVIFRSEQFHKSATYDIETKLIGYLAAEQKLKLRNIESNQGDHEYFLKYAYEALIQKIWEYMRSKGLAYKTINEIEQSTIFKFSPYKNLNSSQSNAVDTTKKNLDSKLTIIKGYPGTGKSIVASRLYMDLSKNNDVCLTSGTHPTVNAFKQVFKIHNKTILTNSKILKTSQLLKTNEQFDIIIVDEAHRLLKKGGKGHPMKYAHIPKEQNELKMLLEKFKHVILLYDENQIVHDGDITLDITGKKYRLNQKAITLELNQQMRSTDGYHYINSIIKVLSGSNDQMQLGKYDFKIFDSFKDMYLDLKNKSQNHPLTRITSGYTRKWNRSKNPNVYDFNIEKIKLKWNSKAEGWIYSKNAKNLSEIGYYHSVQGFDLDYTGVIIGKDLCIDSNNELQVNEKYIVAANEKPKKSDPHYYEKLKQWVLNRYKILLTRGIRGTYVYIEDQKVREYFKKLLVK